MNPFWISILVVAAVVVTLVACAAQKQSANSVDAQTAVEGQKKASIGQIDGRGLKASLDEGKVPLLLDVRTPGEFQGGHVPNALNIPLSELSSRLSELNEHKADDIYVICRSGNRSMTASKLLLKAGFKPTNVKGGTLAWQGLGYSIQR